MFLYILLFVVGLALLVKGADFLVDGASSLAKRFNIPELVIGLTIVAFGTSAPELVVNVIASSKGLSDVVLGNIIGSNLFNLLAILGIAGLIYPLSVTKNTVWKEMPYSFLAALVLLILANDHWTGADQDQVGRMDGVVLLLFFVAFLAYIALSLKQEPTVEVGEQEVLGKLKTGIYIVGGLAGLMIGGKLVVDNAINIARTMDVSERLISLTIVAAGTSLPELATSAMAAYKKKSDLAVGNIVGSNIFNIFLILGISATVNPVAYLPASYNMPVFLLLGGTLLTFGAMFTGKRKMLDRWEAAILLIVFVGYTTYLITAG